MKPKESEVAQGQFHQRSKAGLKVVLGERTFERSAEGKKLEEAALEKLMSVSCWATLMSLECFVA